jgi:hypothetical protein
MFEEVVFAVLFAVSAVGAAAGSSVRKLGAHDYRKSPGRNEPGLQGGGLLHAPPILSKEQIHINGCPKNAGRCPKKDPV